MKQFFKILKFEFLGYVKNKIFVGITLFLVAAIAVVTFIPNIVDAFSSPDGSTPSDGGEKPVMLITSEHKTLAQSVKESFSAVFEEYDVRLYDDSLDELKKAVTSGDAECAFVLESATSYTYYVDDLSMYDFNASSAESALREVAKLAAMLDYGLTLEQATQISSIEINGSVETLGKDQTNDFFYTYLMIMVLYMAILLYGQMVATNVASEKSSRAMELLITSAKPSAMMFGKVVASCLAGLSQLVAIFGSMFVFFNINRSAWDENGIINKLFDIPPHLLVYMLIFFVLGFLIYAFLYGAVGSTASKLEDINTSVMPITFAFVIAFIVVMISMSSGEVDSPLMIACSYIPFTSPMAMFTRICMSTVPIWEIILSVIILAASTVGVGFLSARIYRVGVLLYGNRPSIVKIIKTVFGKGKG